MRGAGIFTKTSKHTVNGMIESRPQRRDQVAANYDVQ